MKNLKTSELISILTGISMPLAIVCSDCAFGQTVSLKRMKPAGLSLKIPNKLKSSKDSGIAHSALTSRPKSPATPDGVGHGTIHVTSPGGRTREMSTDQAVGETRDSNIKSIPKKGKVDKNLLGPNDRKDIR